jgi:putative PIN family toxin of toxin-antitoxin system
LTATVKVVLDANVLVSAAIQAGPSYRIVAHWLDRGGLEVVICPALLEEVEHVLDRPRLRKRVEPGVAQLYMATVRRIADLVADPASVDAETRDPDDDYLVALAREHGVDWIVTGDKDLLEWEDQLPPAITPAAFEVLLDGPGN